MSIRERLDECDRMCGKITEARVSDAAQHDLKGLLHRDMMQFCVYLSLQDRQFTAAQRAYIKANLGFDLSYADRTGLYDKVGKKLYLMGTSENVARFSGLKVDWLIIKTYALSGILAAMGGMIMLANYNSARSDYGSVYTLQCILIVVLGGVSPTGGKGKISGVMLSIILLSLLEAGINRFPQISSYYITLIWGAVLLLVMVLNYFAEHPLNVRPSKKAA